MSGEKQSVPYSSVELFRGRGTIPDLTPEQSRDTLWAFNSLFIWKIYDPDLLEWEILGDVNDDVRVVYQVTKLGWPIADREMVCLQSKFDIDGKHGIAYKSLPESEIFATESGNVRSTANVNGFIFDKQDNGSTRATRIVQVDPNGQLPSSVVNYFATGCYKFSVDLAPALKKIHTSLFKQ
eukprot:TRINITY_DN4730_c0_g1_i2.p1 TRINITY_DN4730_c0_g1~~TRINITY_DN4730_c0_g1_i2.p1  ORF type:complete len:181 (+),score=42.68 TRINITY_DN4730_c0_g1_i2:353-895(+)